MEQCDEDSFDLAKAFCCDRIPLTGHWSLGTFLKEKAHRGATQDPYKVPN